MGVMGTLAVYENNRFHAKQRSICAYCEGTGFIKGASFQSSTGEWLRKADGVCINCEGTGLSIPATLDRKGIKQQDDELETKLDEIGIAALADDIVRAENSPGDMLEVTRMLQRRALARAGQKKPLTEAEKCGFQCRYSLQMARRCKPFSHKTFAVKADALRALGQKMLLPWMSERRSSWRERVGRRWCLLLTFSYYAGSRGRARRTRRRRSAWRTPGNNKTLRIHRLAPASMAYRGETPRTIHAAARRP